MWEVDLPFEDVPPNLPVPALGINFARDGMQKKDWLSLVAMHSDAWLLSVASYIGARFGFDKANRGRLLDMINDLPTIFEVVTGMAKKQGKEKSSVSNHKKSKTNSKRGYKPQGKYSKAMQSKDQDEDGLEVDDEEEHGETLCGTCGLNYAGDTCDFWICCDICDKWFHGKCVKVTPHRVVHIKQYKCPSCREDGLEVDDEEEHGETLCGACGLNYAGEACDFWICCDICDKWFHGKCVKVTPDRVVHIKQYKCPSCRIKRARP